MLRKIRVVLLSLIVAASTSVVPADAATKVSNGVKCTKRNAVTKVGTDVYRCTTNPISTSKALVWVWQGCLDSNKAFLSTQSQYNSILKQIASQSTTLAANIQTSIDRMILWKDSKTYSKDDIVFETGKSYYISLINDNKSKQPSTSLGTAWAVYMPTAADANVGTSPDANKVISLKEKDVVDWSGSVAALEKYIKDLEGLKNPTAAQKTKLATYKTQVATLKIGIKNANTNIKNLKANMTLLANQETNKATVESLKADVAQARSIRAQSCARGV